MTCLYSLAFKARKDLENFLKENGVHPLLTYAPMLCQGFVFCSMFFALRGMAEAPVASMKTEGVLWFVDLTARDPFLMLPLMTCMSLYTYIKVGGDGVNLNTVPPFMRKLIEVMPFISLPVMCAFPTASYLILFCSHMLTESKMFLRNNSLRPSTSTGSRPI